MSEPGLVSSLPAEVAALDPESFYSLVEPSIPKMGRVAARLAGPSERDDVVQQALLHAWRNRRQYDSSRGSLSAWLLAITAHEASRLARTLSRRPAVPDTFEPTAAFSSVELKDAVDKLTKRERLAVDCYYFLGLSVAETAGVMACSEGTVKSTLASARSRLLDQLR